MNTVFGKILSEHSRPEPLFMYSCPPGMLVEIDALAVVE
jgi:hypothetical protein